MKRGTALLALAILLAASSGAAAAPPRRAILLRGADAVKGLPFFAPNAIDALSGLYALESPAAAGGADSVAGPAAGPAQGRAAQARAAQVAVWYSRENIVFAPSWKRVDPRSAGPYADAAYSLERGEGAVLALVSQGYTLFFELPGDPRAADFARAFSAKFPIFFRNAASDAELSFPAYVDY